MKQLAQTKTHKVKNFAYFAGKTSLLNKNGLQNKLAKKPAKEKEIKFGRNAFAENLAGNEPSKMIYI